MNEQKFWYIIDAARHIGGECQSNAVMLEELLVDLSITDIELFYEIFVNMCRQAFRYELKAAAWIMNGSGSDDGFTDFQSWLIGQGRKIYYEALVDLDSLAELNLVPGTRAVCEELAYAALYAYERKAGHEYPIPDRPYIQISGHAYDFDDDQELSRAFPKLWRKYNE